jgi:tRNA/rRNA methyltransferase
MAENVGFAARSMKNFNLQDLRLVLPGLMEDGEWEAEQHNKNFNLNDFLHKAEAVAKGGGDIIKNAKIFNSIEDACFDVSYLYALSARRRDIAKEVINPDMAIQDVCNTCEKSAFLFGRESSGLSNKDLTLAYKIVEFSANQNYSSVNLGMSVGIISYLLNRQNQLSHQSQNVSLKKINNLASLKEVNNMFDFLESKLTELSYFKALNQKDVMMGNIKNIFSRNSLTKSEVKTLAGVFALLKKSD